MSLQFFKPSDSSDDMDSLRVEMSGLLKELQCPFEGAVSGVLRGSTLTTKDHLKIICM